MPAYIRTVQNRFVLPFLFVSCAHRTTFKKQMNLGFNIAYGIRHLFPTEYGRVLTHDATLIAGKTERFPTLPASGWLCGIAQRQQPLLPEWIVRIEASRSAVRARISAAARVL